MNKFIALLCLFIAVSCSSKEKPSTIAKTTTNKTVCMKGEQFYDEKGGIIKPDVTYQVVKEEVTDNKKTQFLSLEGNFDKEVILKVLEISYQKIQNKEANASNSYSIMVYQGTEQAEKQLSWLGQLIKHPNTPQYNIELNESLIISSREVTSEKFGFTEVVRKDIFKLLANPSKLSQKTIDSIYAKYQINEAISDSISLEGSLKGWIY